MERVWGWDEEEQRRLHEQRFGSQDVQIVGLAGARVGILAVATAPDRVNLNQIFLLPEYQRRGVGRACMSLIIEEADRLGLPVRLRVLKINGSAQAFFRKLAFIWTGETDAHILMERAP